LLPPPYRYSSELFLDLIALRAISFAISHVDQIPYFRDCLYHWKQLSNVCMQPSMVYS
jgi:hypothetical protein